MATRAITLTLSVRDADTVRRELERIGPAGEEAIRRLDAAAQKAASGNGGMRGVSNAAGELQASLANLASRAGPVGSALSGLGGAGLAAAAGIGALTLGLSQVARAGDEMVATLSRIRVATGNIESARQVYEQLYQISLQTGQAVSESASQFARYSIAARQIGATNAEVVKLVDGIQKAATLMGASAQESAATAIQLGQALASGVLQGEELRSLLENMPNLAEQLARELGVGMGELRKMGAEGELTAERVFPALLRASQSLNDEYEKMPVTMSRAFSQLQIAADGFASRLDEALGISQKLTAAFGAAADALNRMRDALPTEASRAADRTVELNTEIKALRDRIALLSPSGEVEMRAAPRRGGLSSQLQVIGAQNAGEDLVGELREQLAQREQELRAHVDRMVSTSVDGYGREIEELNTTNERALQSRRERSQKEIDELRLNLDQALKVRKEYESRVETINRAQANGALSAAEAEQMLAQAAKDRDEALKRAAGTARQSYSEQDVFAMNVIRRQGEILEQEEKRQQAAWERSQQITAGYEDSLAVIQRETELVGASVEQREVELAVLRETQRLKKEQIDLDSDEAKRRLDLVAQIARGNVALRQQRDAIQEIGRIGENAFERLGDSLVDAFVRGEGKAVNFGNVLRGIAASALADFAKLALWNPIRNSLFGGDATTLSGGSGGSSSSGGMSLLSLANTGRSLWSAWGGGSISSGLDAWGASNLGFLGFGGLSNAANPASLAATTPEALFAAMPATPGALPGLLNGGSALAGFGSFSNVLGVAGSVLPGLISGNYAQAATGGIGAAIGTAILPGVGTIVGGTLGNLVGGLFGGGKTANPASSVQIGIDDNGQLVVVGSRSKHMSSAEGIAQTNEALAGLNSAVSSRGLSLRSSGGAVIGQTFQGNDTRYNESAQRDFTQSILNSLTGGSDSVMAVVARQAARGAEASLEQAFADIDWVRGIYEPLSSLDPALSAFDAQIRSINETFDAATARARELGLATDNLTTNQAKQIKALEDSRQAQVWDFETGLTVRRLRATGQDEQADLLAQEVATRQQLEQARTFYESLGVSSEETARRMLLVEQTLAAERLAIQESYAERARQAEEAARQSAEQAAAGVITSLADYARSLNYGEASPLGANEQFMTARSLFLTGREAALNGDAAAIQQLQGLSQDYLSTARNLYGSGAGYAAAFEQVQDALGQIGTVSPDTLTASFIAQNTQTQTEALVEALARLQAEVSALRREQQQSNARPNAA